MMTKIMRKMNIRKLTWMICLIDKKMITLTANEKNQEAEAQVKENDQDKEVKKVQVNENHQDKEVKMVQVNENHQNKEVKEVVKAFESCKIKMQQRFQ
jgi:hypothetical protein